MKATSKFISAVLILALCMSLFTASASAVTVAVDGYNPDNPSENVIVVDGAPVENTQQPASNGAAPSAAGSVTDGASLLAAVRNAAAGGTVTLGANIQLSSALVLDKALTLDLNGKSLSFSNAGDAQDAAIVANAPVTVRNGFISAAYQEEDIEHPVDSGFRKLASGSVSLVNVGVSFAAGESFNPFGGVSYDGGHEAVYEEGRWKIVAVETAELEPEVAAAPAEADESMDTMMDPVEEPETEDMDDTGMEGEVETDAVEEAPEEEPAEEGAEAGDEAAADENADNEAEITEEPAAEEPAEEGAEAGDDAAADENADNAAEITEEPAEEGEEAGDEAAADENADNEAEITEEPAAEEPAEEGAEAGDEAAADENAEAAEGEDALPKSDEEQAAELSDDVINLPVDETPVDVEEEKPAEEVEEVRGELQLQELSVTVGDTVITVKGELPEGTQVVATAINAEAATGEELLAAFDISLLDADGVEFEPETPVIVTIDNPAIREYLTNAYRVTIEHEDAEAGRVPVSMDEAVEGAISFVTDSFSPFIISSNSDPANAIVKKTEYDGETHNTQVKAYLNKEFIVKGTGGLEIYVKGAAPEAVSILDPEDVSSGNVAVYKAGLLDYMDDSTNANISYKIEKYTGSEYDADYKITILEDFAAPSTGADEHPAGKWAVALWYKDTDKNDNSTRVYVVKYFYLVSKAGIFPVSPWSDEDQMFYVEKCDFEPVILQISDAVKSFTITGSGDNVSYDASNKTKIKINGTNYNASEYFSVSDYMAKDLVGHNYVPGKALTLYSSLIQKLAFGNHTLTVTLKDGSSKSFKMNLAPGIGVADGLNDYIKGSNLWIKFVACWPIDYDADGSLAIWIGGQKIGHEYYSISNDHKTLWIYRNLLDQLRSNNSYTLTARLWRWADDPNGNLRKETAMSSASFNILAAGSTSVRSPKTGDNANIGLWAAVLVVSGAAVVALIPKKKKKSNV